AILLDGLDQVADDPDVALAESAVLERLRLADTGAGDGLPGRFAAGGEPAWIVEIEDRRQAAGGELNDAAGAEDGEAEAVGLTLAARTFGRGEMTDDAFVEPVHGGDVIAGDGPHVFAAFANVGLGREPHRQAGRLSHLFDDADARVAP